MEVSAGAALEAGILNLEYRVRGSGIPFVFSGLPEIHSERKSDLWKETCFEAFLELGVGEGYLEFNGSLSGAWDLYHFDSYRSGMKRVIGASEPCLIEREVDQGVLVVKWSVPVPEGAILTGKTGLTVVFKPGERPSYWALCHDGGKPDFHLKSGFIYDSIRN